MQASVNLVYQNYRSISRIIKQWNKIKESPCTV